MSAATAAAPRPSSYEEMEPYATNGEKLYQVHVDRGDGPTESPCGAVYLLPPAPHELRIQQASNDLENGGFTRSLAVRDPGLTRATCLTRVCAA